MRIESYKYRTEDMQDIIIIVECYDSSYSKEPIIWRIADIKYKTSRQRNYRYFSETFRDNYTYRQLDMDERNNYALEKYKEFVGIDKLKATLIAAWENIKPDLENINVRNI